MATTKKTVKNDTADKKKSTTTKKKTTTAKKKTNVKKEAESTGVVDEFLNENIGKVVTETEAPKPEKKTTTTKKTDENKLIDAEAELNEILSQQITEENIRVADEIEKTINEQKELNEKLEELGLTEETSSNINEITDKIADNGETKEPNNAVYPPIVEPTEKETPITVDDLRVNLEAKPQQRFTYVNTSMGVKYD